MNSAKQISTPPGQGKRTVPNKPTHRIKETTKRHQCVNKVYFCMNNVPTTVRELVQIRKVKIKRRLKELNETETEG
jgi:hypothetical protein